MSMSRKHYTAVADLLSDLANTLSDPTQAWDIALADHVDALADLFEADNPNFDRTRFRAAAIPDLRYKATHVSVLDGSPAMVVSSDLDSITLVNEDGFRWIDPVERWERIAS